MCECLPSSPVGHCWRAESRSHALRSSHGHLWVVLGEILEDSDLDVLELAEVIMLIEVVRVLVLLMVDLMLHLELKAVLRRHCDGL